MTFASNLATGDVIDFVTLLGNVFDIGQPSDDTVTAAKLNNDVISGQTALTSSPDDTDELLISDAGTIKRIDVSLVGGKNTPAFLAKPATAATISDATLTKVSFTEVVDTDNAYDGSRFTPGVAGYYQVNAIVEVSDGSNGYGARIVIYKNGSADTSIDSALDGNDFLALTRISVAGVIYLDANDYIEVYAEWIVTGKPFL